MSRWTAQMAGSSQRPKLGELSNGFRNECNPSEWLQCLGKRPWMARPTERL
ncbi:hypothetical protein OKW46_001305 [Paraburkholderia sp. WSM4179]|nr:hypothetical protein [Paraburkholderia sp. WSM4179]